MKLLLVMLIAGAALASAQPAKSPYATNCAACHQATGKGVPGAFPPLAGHFSDLLAADGRTYTLNVLLYGLAGPIKVNGKAYNGVMPAFAQLSDEDLAAILNEVSTSWKNALPAGQKPYTAQDVSAARTAKKTPAQVHDLRPTTLK